MSSAFMSLQGNERRLLDSSSPGGHWGTSVGFALLSVNGNTNPGLMSFSHSERIYQALTTHSARGWTHQGIGNKVNSVFILKELTDVRDFIELLRVSVDEFFGPGDWRLSAWPGFRFSPFLPLTDWAGAPLLWASPTEQRCGDRCAGGCLSFTFGLYESSDCSHLVRSSRNHCRWPGSTRVLLTLKPNRLP